jgi:hypothetical protein
LEISCNSRKLIFYHQSAPESGTDSASGRA